MLVVLVEAWIVLINWVWSVATATPLFFWVGIEMRTRENIDWIEEEKRAEK